MSFYAFLSPAPMSTLWEKALHDMKPGSLPISNTFLIPGITAEEEINVGDTHETRFTSIGSRSEPNFLLIDCHQGLRSAGNTQRLENCAHMHFDRTLCQAEQRGNIAIRLSQRHQAQHFALAFRQPNLRRINLTSDRCARGRATEATASCSGANTLPLSTPRRTSSKRSLE